MLIITIIIYLLRDPTSSRRQLDLTTDPRLPPLHFKLKSNLSPDHLIIDFVYFALVLPTRFS